MYISYFGSNYILNILFGFQSIADDDFKHRGINFYTFLGTLKGENLIPDHLTIMLTSLCFDMKLTMFGNPHGQKEWNSESSPNVGVMFAYLGKGSYYLVDVGTFIYLHSWHKCFQVI